MVEAKILRFKLLKELYADDSDFGNIYKECENGAFEDFYKHDEFLFKGHKLCAPKSSLQELFMKESHEGGLMRHFGVQKTLDMLHDNFF